MMCYVESGYPSLQELVKYKQHKFFNKMWQERSEDRDDPLSFVIRTVTDTNTVTGRLVSGYIAREIVDLKVAMGDVVTGIRNSESSRRKIYKEMNPSYEVHRIYKEKHGTNEVHRLSFTRFRVCGHSLACETDRWNRRGRGRLPPDERLCMCGAIQSEQHVVQNCSLTSHLRQAYNFDTLEQLMSSDQFTPVTLCKIIHDILTVYS